MIHYSYHRTERCSIIGSLFQQVDDSAKVDSTYYILSNQLAMGVCGHKLQGLNIFRVSIIFRGSNRIYSKLQ